MTTPTVIETRRTGNQIRKVGPRVELARYAVGACAGLRSRRRHEAVQALGMILR